MRHVTVSVVSSAECPRNGDRTRDPHPRRLYRRHSARALSLCASSRQSVEPHARGDTYPYAVDDDRDDDDRDDDDGKRGCVHER